MSDFGVPKIDRSAIEARWLANNNVTKETRDGSQHKIYEGEDSTIVKIRWAAPGGLVPNEDTLKWVEILQIDSTEKDST